MSTASNVSSIQRKPELLGQTVVVIGGSAGIGLAPIRVNLIRRLRRHIFVGIASRR